MFFSLSSYFPRCSNKNWQLHFFLQKLYSNSQFINYILVCLKRQKITFDLNIIEIGFREITEFFYFYKTLNINALDSHLNQENVQTHTLHSIFYCFWQQAFSRVVFSSQFPNQLNTSIYDLGIFPIYYNQIQMLLK